MQDAGQGELAALRHVVEAYCRALWTSDVATLSALFHPRCNLYGVGANGLEEHSRDAWLDIVRARPGGEGDAPVHIHHMHMLAPDMAFAAFDCAAPGRTFTDGLNLLKIAGEWKVIAKTFHIHA